MANTGSQQLYFAHLNSSGSGFVATGSSGTTGAMTGVAFVDCVEAILAIECLSVSSAGIVTPKLQTSVDGGTTWTDLTATTGSALSNVSAAGTQTYRYKGGFGTKVRLFFTGVSGTSVTVTAYLIGLVPIDSTLATAV